MNPTIQELKAKIGSVRAGITKKHSLQKKREELENFFEDSKQKAEKMLLKAHQNQLEEHYSKAKEYEELSKQLLQKLTQVDKEIDLWEEAEEDDITHLQNQLVVAILNDNPLQKETFALLQANQKNWELIRNNNEHVLTLLANLEHLIATIQTTRNRIKRQGLLSYIFGSSPNLMVSKCLQGIATLLAEEKNALIAIQKNMPDKEMKDAVHELHSYALEFEKECQKRWSYRKLDKLIETHSIKIQGFKARFEQFQLFVTAQNKKIENEFQEWLSKF